MKPFPEIISKIVNAGGLINFKYDGEKGAT